MKAKMKIRVEGADLSAFLSAAANGGNDLCRIERKGNILTAVCDEKDEKHLRRAAARCGLLFSVESKTDMKSRARAIVSHAGIIAAVVVIVASLIVSRFFVFSVSVTGASPALSSEIIALLKAEGIEGLTLKSGIDLQNVEKIVENGSGDVAFAEAYIDGVKLVVNVREQLPEPIAEEEKGKLYASSDAIVTRVEISGGTAVVKAGDTVRKGDVLIEDYIVVGDPLDPDHKEIETAAKGDVYGRVWYTERLLIPTSREVTERTGESYCSTALYLGDRLLIPARENHGFKEYERTVETKRINGALPFTLVTYSYYETRKQTAVTDEAYIESEVYASFARLYASLDSSATVLTSYKSQKKVDNYYIIILYYEVEQLIGCREA